MTVSVQMVEGNMTVLVAACCVVLSPLWPEMTGAVLSSSEFQCCSLHYLSVKQLLRPSSIISLNISRLSSGVWSN